MEAHALAARSHALAALAHAMTTARPSSFEHSNRVAHNATCIGELFGFRGADLMALGWAGLLHDLGKIAIPGEILDKPGRLDPAERDEMRQHPAIGAAVVLAVSEDLAPIADAIRTHHERWDGGGYPNGLAGEDIPLAGRILAVVDVYDALTCDRAYRAHPKTEPEALSLVRDWSDHAFDPRIVGAFQELLIADWLQVRDHGGTRHHSAAA